MQSSVPEVHTKQGKVTAGRVQLGFSELKNKLEFDRKYLNVKKKKIAVNCMELFSV